VIRTFAMTRNDLAPCGNDIDTGGLCGGAGSDADVVEEGLHADV
jgi:hypothetical protein